MLVIGVMSGATPQQTGGNIVGVSSAVVNDITGTRRLAMSDEHVRESPPQPTRETATGGASRAMLEYGWASPPHPVIALNQD